MTIEHLDTGSKLHKGEGDIDIPQNFISSVAVAPEKPEAGASLAAVPVKEARRSLQPILDPREAELIAIGTRGLSGCAKARRDALLAQLGRGREAVTSRTDTRGSGD